MKTGLLLIAHGSREAAANADLEYVAEQLRQRGYEIAVAAYLELAEPNIEAGGVRCIERGAECVVMVPYFLSAGVHVRRDLTQAREKLAQRFPEVEFRLAEPLGRHPQLIDVIVNRVRETDEAADVREESQS